MIARPALLGISMLAFAFALIHAAGVTGRPMPARPDVHSVPAPAGTLAQAGAFDRIADRRTRSLALFAEVGKVLQHPRCLNCHPAGASPTQTDGMRPHLPHVVRGGGVGVAGMYCSTCHHARNYDVAGVPGNPKWALAPPEMAWQGKSLGAICRQLKDRARNGGRDMAAMQVHMATDELVGWGWHPGGHRTPVPGTQAQFGALFDAWVKSGASCPT